MTSRKAIWGIALIALFAFTTAGCAKMGMSKASGDKLNKIHFDFDKSDIRSDQAKTLKGNAKWIKANSNHKVSIQGHCDERGTPEYNIALGDRRARAAKSYLVNLGIDADLLKTVSYGEEKPDCKKADEECYAKNRRAEFKK